MQLTNVILTNEWRKQLESEIHHMNTSVPDMMARKISRANVQQAWMLHMLKKHGDKSKEILCIGSHEDTCAYTLIYEGWNIHCIDPIYNYDLHQYMNISNRPENFDIVFSTSVIEHEQNDELFLQEMCLLLKKGGFGFLTCDFNNLYPYVPKPLVDKRLYTDNDLTERFPAILKKYECSVYGDVDYTADVDFHYENCIYGFATFAFTKD